MRPVFHCVQAIFIVVLLVADAPILAALDPTQTQALATVENGLKQVETNLKLAQDTAGPGTAALEGSKARLTQTRLAQAKAPVTQIVDILSKLPVADPQVQAAQKRLDAVNTSIAALETRLAGQPVAPPAEANTKATPEKSLPGKASPPTADGEIKLDYKQEQLAKDARSYLDEIAGLAGGVGEVVKKIEAAKDPLSLDHRLVQSAANSIAKGRQRADLVKGRIDQLPKNGKGVAVLSTQYNELLASLATSEKIVSPLHKKLSTLVDPASYPELEADIKRTQQLALMYQNADALTRNMEQAAALIGQAPAAEAEAQRFAKMYAPLVQQQTPAGERVEKMTQFFQQNFAAFTAAAAKRKSTLPAELDTDLAKVRQLAETAVKEQKPAFFTNGIPDAVAHAESKLVLFTTIDVSGAAAAKAKIEQVKQQLKAGEASLREAIITANELPPSRYAGQDKLNLEKIAVAAWKQSEPKAEVLAIRFPSENWEREALLRYENRAWHLIDRSKLQAQLLIKQDNKTAVIRPINLTTDHLNNNKITASPLDDAKESLSPSRYLLLDKIK